MTGRVEMALDGCLLGGVSILSGLAGLLVGGIGFLGLVDPAGTQLANDADPFGTPPSAWWGFTLLVIGLALMVWPLPLLLRRQGLRPQEPD